MINQWNEIDLEMFYELFDFYRNHKGTSENKVIEIQNLSGKYYEEIPYTRIFIGSKINPLDYREWNSGICAVYDTFKDTLGKDELDEEFRVLNLCFFAESAGPMITPFGPTPKNIDTFFATSFGDSEKMQNTSMERKGGYSRLILWYTRDKDGKIVYDMSRKKTTLPDTKRYIRVRTMDFSDWKLAIEDSIIHARVPDYFSKDDITKEDFGKVTEQEVDD